MKLIEENKLFHPYKLASEHFKSASKATEWKGRIIHLIVGVLESCFPLNYLFAYFDNTVFKKNPIQTKSPLQSEISQKAENIPPVSVIKNNNKSIPNIIGIDLGTTNSCVSIFKDGKCEVISSEEGNRTTSSVITYKDDQIIVGTQTKAQTEANQTSTLHSTKRFIGRKYDEIAAEASMQPYKVIKNENGDPVFEINGKIITPEAAAAEILSKMKKIAEKHLGEEVTKAVVTVPAYFNDAQRQATRAAGKIAGLDVLRIIAEPTAASLAYGVDKKGKNKKDMRQNIVVYDLGGGTFDVSILIIEDGIFEVCSTNGDTHLGGDDFDHAIVNWIVKEVKEKKQIDLSKDKTIMEKLRDAAVKAKIELSNSFSAQIDLSDIATDSNGLKNLVLTLSRKKFEKISQPLINRTLKSCNQALTDSKLSKKDIDQVILVGGMTRMPAIRKALENRFNKKPNTNVNPDEAVSIGAAIQGAVIGGDIDNVLLIDVAPLTLGIEIKGGAIMPIIERNTSIPIRKSQIFSTASDNQSSVKIDIFQGERLMSNDNKKIGSFVLSDIAPAPRGVPQIEVCFMLNADGILEVSAKDKLSGKEQKIRIEAKSNLTNDEVKAKVADAEKHQEEDEKKKEEIFTKNEAEATVFRTEKALSDYKDMISAEISSEIQSKVDKVKDALKGSDIAIIKSSLKELEKNMQKIGEELQKAQAADQSS